VKTTVGEKTGNDVTLEIEVSADEVQKGIDATVKQLSREVRIPGFRKGKVPTGIIVQRFGMEAIVHQMLDDHLSEWYAAALLEAELEPVDRPTVDFENAPEQGEPFTFTAVVTVMPTAELGEYKGVEAPREDAEVEDAEVDERVDRLREEFAELKSAGDRAAAEGDHVTIDAEGFRDGEAVPNTKLDDYMFEIGAGYLLPDLENGVIGMKSGEEHTIPVGFPDDYPAEELQGATLEFVVTLKDVKEKSLPTLNDEFAKDVSEFETLLELRMDIRNKLQAAKDSSADRQFRAAVIDAVAAGVTVDLPPAAIDRQAREMVDDFARSLQMQGGDIQGYLQATGGDLELLVQQMIPDAEDALRTGLALDAVAAAEGLEVTDEELAERLDRMAAMGRVEAGELRSRLEQSGRISEIRQQILREHAADLIAENAVPVAPPPPTDDQPGEEVEEADEAAPEEVPVEEQGAD
jgi:trigger factor